MPRVPASLALFLCLHSSAWASVDDPFTNGNWLIGLVLGGCLFCSCVLIYVLNLRRR